MVGRDYKRMQIRDVHLRFAISAKMIMFIDEPVGYELKPISSDYIPEEDDWVYYVNIKKSQCATCGIKYITRVTSSLVQGHACSVCN